MISDVRLVKFATLGVQGAVPTTIRDAVQTAAFTLGFVTKVAEQRAATQPLTEEELEVLHEISNVTKQAHELTDDLIALQKVADVSSVGDVDRALFVLTKAGSLRVDKLAADPTDPEMPGGIAELMARIQEMARQAQAGIGAGGQAAAPFADALSRSGGMSGMRDNVAELARQLQTGAPNQSLDPAIADLLPRPDVSPADAAPADAAPADAAPADVSPAAAAAAAPAATAGDVPAAADATGGLDLDVLRMLGLDNIGNLNPNMLTVDHLTEALKNIDPTDPVTLGLGGAGLAGLTGLGLMGKRMLGRGGSKKKASFNPVEAEFGSYRRALDHLGVPSEAATFIMSGKTAGFNIGVLSLLAA